MLVIVDGVDRVGKGTFIQALIDQMPELFPVVLSNKSPPKTLPLKVRRTWALAHYRHQYGILAGGFSPVIIDRGHYSEFVYGDLYRGESTTGLFFQQWEEKALKELERQAVCSVILEGDPLDIIKRDDGHSTFSGQPNPILALRKECEYFHRLRLATKFPTLYNPTPERVMTVLDGQIDW